MSNRQILFVVGIISLLSWDFFSRFSIDSQTYETLFKEKLVSVQLPRTLSKGNLDAIKQQYQTYDPQAPNQREAIDEPIMSLAQQQQQRGKLTKLYVGEYIIRLTGAVLDYAVKRNETQQSDFAIVYVEHAISNKMSSDKLIKSQEFMGYVVKSVELNQIELVSLDDPNRQVFLVMYEDI